MRVRFLESILLFSVALLGLVSHVAAGHSLGSDFHPEVLTDANFDETVFPSDRPVSQQRPFVIMFYAPWCGHCKHMLPVFHNASRLLYTTPGFTWATDSARFAVVDATTNTRVAQQFKVKSYPTFFYTINGRGYRYGAALTLQDLATNAVFLFQGHKLRSFADDITHITEYRSVANAEVPRRPLFVICRPTRTPQREDGSPHDYNAFVESVLLQGRPRFAQFVEDESTLSIEERPKIFKDILQKQHWLIAEACAAGLKEVKAAAGKQEGQAAGAGPEGEVLLLLSDKTAKPIVYRGPWGGGEEVPMSDALIPFISIKGSNPYRTSRQIALWVWENSYSGVEKVTAEIIAGLTRRGKLGILVVEGELNYRADKKYLPAMQSLAQRRYAAFRKSNPHYTTGIAANLFMSGDSSMNGNTGKIPADFERPSSLQKIRESSPVQIAIADGKLFASWVNSLGYSLPLEEGGANADNAAGYPKFFVIDAMKDVIWRIEEWLPSNGLPADLLASVGKEGSVMSPDGEEIKAIAKFIAAIEVPESDPSALRGVPTTTMGLIARYITDYVPFSSHVSAMLGDDPLLFLTVVGCCLMFVFVIIVSLRKGGDSEDEEAELRALREAKKARAAAKAKAALQQAEGERESQTAQGSANASSTEKPTKKVSGKEKAE